MRATEWKYQDETELAKLVELYRELTPRKNILEIGSMWGGTLRQWIQYAERPATLVAIDALVSAADDRYEVQRDGHEVSWRKFAYDHGHLLYVFDRNSRDRQCISIVSHLMPSVDFLFIDGGHDYDTVLDDWNNYGRLVRPGGIVAFHDLGREHPGVRPVWERARTGKRSVEFCERPEMYGIGALYA